MTVDPMDLNVSRAEEGLQPEHDAMAYCKNCRVNVQLDSKHCWDCNKCVSNYDHHCPWLNTCIGTRNYFYFYVSIWSLLVMLATSSTADVLVIVEHARDSTNALGLGSVLVWLISIILALVDIPLCFLDSTLVAFHTYLCVLDITTYDYLTGKTSQKKARWKEQRECETHEGREVQRSDLAVRNRRMLDAVPHFGGAPAPNRRGSRLLKGLFHIFSIRVLMSGATTVRLLTLDINDGVIQLLRNESEGGTPLDPFAEWPMAVSCLTSSERGRAYMICTSCSCLRAPIRQPDPRPSIFEGS